MAERASWLDESGSPSIEGQARKLTSFMEAMADGVVDQGEVAAQEKRVADLMRQIEPKLDDALHAEVTELLCEVTAFDIMNLLHNLQSARVKNFRG